MKKTSIFLLVIVLVLSALPTFAGGVSCPSCGDGFLTVSINNCITTAECNNCSYRDKEHTDNHRFDAHTVDCQDIANCVTCGEPGPNGRYHATTYSEIVESGNCVTATKHENFCTKCETTQGYWYSLADQDKHDNVIKATVTYEENGQTITEERDYCTDCKSFID